MDEEINESLRKTDFCLKKLIYKIGSMLRDIPDKQKQDIRNDLIDILMAVINSNLNQINVEWSQDACVGVVMASAGYPGSYKTGFPITGLDKVDKDILVFHAGTEIGNEPGQVLTNGGRVLTVVALGKTIAEAREKVYANIPRIHFEGCHYRTDIAEIKRG